MSYLTQIFLTIYIHELSHVNLLDFHQMVSVHGWHSHQSVLKINQPGGAGQGAGLERIHFLCSFKHSLAVAFADDHIPSMDVPWKRRKGGGGRGEEAEKECSEFDKST